MSTSEVPRSNSLEMSGSAAGQMRVLRIALGVGTVLLGLAALFWPKVTLAVVAILFGAQLVIAGAMRVVSAFVSDTLDGWLRAVMFLIGVLVLLAGLFCLRNPFASLLSLILLISFGWVVEGIVELVAATSPQPASARWLHALSGIALIVGAMLMLFWPKLALLTFTALGGWLLVIFGVMTAASGWREPRPVSRSAPMRAGGSTAATA